LDSGFFDLADFVPFAQKKANDIDRKISLSDEGTTQVARRKAEKKFQIYESSRDSLLDLAGNGNLIYSGTSSD
jgi:hypothetical protein